MSDETNHGPDSPPWERSSPEALNELLCGNVDAIRLLHIVARGSHIYDDLIDRDKPIVDEAVHELVWSLLVALPANPFYQAHQHVIRPVLITGILNWKAANDMQAGGVVEELRIAHALRYALADLLLLLMNIVGGHDHAMANARRARLLLQHDTWANYLGEHAPGVQDHA